ncbi:MAG: hypothetical protein NXH82_01040 [Rhodobacteraceae bacterium]|nr:hypothetical protein [Paracoccaceae bacterium]
MKTWMIPVAAATLSLAAAAAQAQDLEYWGSAGGWDVMVDPTLGDGCLILAEYEGDIEVRVGLDRNEGMGYLTLFNENWGEIEEGAVYPITFELDGELFEGEARGIFLDGVPGADIYFNNEDFFWAIADRYAMTIYNADGYEVDTIDLGGTQVGLQAVLECQDDYG